MVNVNERLINKLSSILTFRLLVPLYGILHSSVINSDRNTSGGIDISKVGLVLFGTCEWIGSLHFLESVRRLLSKSGFLLFLLFLDVFLTILNGIELALSSPLRGWY